MSTNYARGAEQGGRPPVAPGGMCWAEAVSLTLQPSGRDAPGTRIHEYMAALLRRESLLRGAGFPEMDS